MGKTAFALGMAANAALEAQRPVLLFSLEMSHLELTQRLLCSEAQVDSTRIRTGNLTEADWTKISHAVGRLAEAPDLDRRQPQRHGHGDPGQGPTAEGQGRRPRAWSWSTTSS